MAGMSSWWSSFFITIILLTPQADAWSFIKPYNVMIICNSVLSLSISFVGIHVCDHIGGQCYFFDCFGNEKNIEELSTSMLYLP